MRRLFPSIIALLMVAGTLPAQTTDSPSTTKKDREPVGINLSLWKNMSTQQTDTVGSTCLNLGLFSSMNRLNGVGINLLGGVVLRDMNGVQITGLANLVGGTRCHFLGAHQYNRRQHQWCYHRWSAEH